MLVAELLPREAMGQLLTPMVGPVGGSSRDVGRPGAGVLVGQYYTLPTGARTDTKIYYVMAGFLSILGFCIAPGSLLIKGLLQVLQKFAIICLP